MVDFEFSAIKRGFDLMFKSIRIYIYAHLVIYMIWRRDIVAKALKNVMRVYSTCIQQ